MKIISRADMEKNARSSSANRKLYQDLYKNIDSASKSRPLQIPMPKEIAGIKDAKAKSKEAASFASKIRQRLHDWMKRGELENLEWSVRRSKDDSCVYVYPNK